MAKALLVADRPTDACRNKAPPGGLGLRQQRESEPGPPPIGRILRPSTACASQRRPRRTKTFSIQVSMEIIMRLLRDNGLTIVLTVLSLLTIAGMILSGWSVYNHELSEHQGIEVGLLAYSTSGHFLSSLFENWESEFLQMSAYVMLTAFLFQRGSAESNDPDDPSDPGKDVVIRNPDQDVPWPLMVGGLARSLYSYSLGIALALLFVLSFVLHLQYSADAQNAEAAMHGQPAVSAFGHLASAQFWFESLQNWQSEFLSTAVLVVLSIFLRFKGSPESKPVSAPNHETGT
ncbi:UNVERIFIED_ORG: hypothetical protein J2W85_004493 [Ensifer adhaerens]|nr:hypothetical protein [Ensifer adhaerens]